MATHSSILAWRIPWIEEHGRLESIGLQRVGHDWAHTHTQVEIRGKTALKLKLFLSNKNHVKNPRATVPESILLWVTKLIHLGLPSETISSHLTKWTTCLLVRNPSTSRQRNTGSRLSYEFSVEITLFFSALFWISIEDIDWSRFISGVEK